MQTVMVSTIKGGDGKTTVATHVAALRAAAGKRVLLVDFDPQANATMSFGLNPTPVLYDMLVRGKDIADSIMQPSNERFCPPGMEPMGRLYVLPGHPETHGIMAQVEHREVFAEALGDIAHAIDEVYIDVPPSPGMLLTMVIDSADWILVPCQLEFLSLMGVTSAIQAATKKGVRLMAIQPNKYREQTDLHKHHLHQLQEMSEANDWLVWEPIAQSIVWAEASALRTMVYSLEGQVGKARGEAIRLADRVGKVLDGVAVHA